MLCGSVLPFRGIIPLLPRFPNLSRLELCVPERSDFDAPKKEVVAQPQVSSQERDSNEEDDHEETRWIMNYMRAARRIFQSLLRHCPLLTPSHLEWNDFDRILSLDELELIEQYLPQCRQLRYVIFDSPHLG